MYTLGVPTGILIDTRGPRPFVIVGAVLLGLGYFPIKQAFDAGSGSIPTLCFFSFLTGFGGCMAFAASIKTSALNWPHHRGTATAFPLAAFGLSAFFFSLLGQLAFPGNTGGFLLLLALGTFGIPFCGFFFLRVLPPSSYHPLSDAPDSHDPVESQRLRRTSSQEAKPVRHGRLFVEPGMSESAAPETSSEARASPSHHPTSDALADVERQAIEEEEEEMDETSSLVSKSSSLPGEVLVQSSVDLDRSHRVDIRGWRLLRNVEFWQFFTIMGLLSGIGLMTIKSVHPVLSGKLVFVGVLMRRTATSATMPMLFGSITTTLSTTPFLSPTSRCMFRFCRLVALEGGFSVVRRSPFLGQRA